MTDHERAASLDAAVRRVVESTLGGLELFATKVNTQLVDSALHEAMALQREADAKIADRLAIGAFHESSEGDSACFTWADRQHDAERITAAIRAGGPHQSEWQQLQPCNNFIRLQHAGQWQGDSCAQCGRPEAEHAGGPK